MSYKDDFPFLQLSSPIVYLDTAASAQKPLSVLKAMERFSKEEYANVHRSLCLRGSMATEKIELARKTIAEFINAPIKDHVIFTSNATDSINLVAQSFLSHTIKPGDEIIVSVMEHHSNIVPWHLLRERCGAVIKWIPLDRNQELDIESYKKLFTDRTVMVALTHMSNVLGTTPPVKKMIQIAHQNNAPVLVDGSQAIVHSAVDVQELGCDFYVFTGHKLYGPTGIGILFFQDRHANNLKPYRGGGEMIDEVYQDRITYADLPHRLEAGTPPILEIVGLMEAINYIKNIGYEEINRLDDTLVTYTIERMQEIKNVRMFAHHQKKSIISFDINGIHPHDLSMILDQYSVCIRAGHHCAQPLLRALGVSSTARVSFGVYNTCADIDVFIDGLKSCVKLFT